MADHNQKQPALLFFYEIQPGDVLKYETKSNSAPSGGGARDVRPRPKDMFLPVLSRMFPIPIKNPETYKGTIRWHDSTGQVESVSISLWTIYVKRPEEIRIATSYKIKAWTVSQADYDLARRNGEKWFYVLIMDTDHEVWAYIMKEAELEEWTPQVRDYVRKRIALAPKHKRPPHIAGTIDFITGVESP